MGEAKDPQILRCTDLNIVMTSRRLNVSCALFLPSGILRRKMIDDTGHGLNDLLGRGVIFSSETNVFFKNLGFRFLSLFFQKILKKV